MLCALSGEPPGEPVVSSKSGRIFERRLIESYIAENSTDPLTGDALALEDLIAVKASSAVKPRPPTLTSIPSLLSVFQNEWDSIALESFALQKTLNKTRLELSHALYENDAAKRVIGRLCKERDEARDALATINAGKPNSQQSSTSNSWDLTSELLDQIDTTRDSLSKTRRKRPIPEGWATAEDIASYLPEPSTGPLSPDAAQLALRADDEIAITGGSNGLLIEYSFEKKKISRSINCNAGITCVLSTQKSPICGTTAGDIQVITSKGTAQSLSAHGAPISALALHSCGNLLASVSDDGAFAFIELGSMAVVARKKVSTMLKVAQFHPDGHLFATGGTDGEITVFDVKTGSQVATFETGGALQALAFSENGTWLAVATQNSSKINIWDLRKSASIHTLEGQCNVNAVKWDYTGQFLASIGDNGTDVFQYSKVNKQWATVYQSSHGGVDIAWGAEARKLYLMQSDGSIMLLSNRH